MVCAARYTNVPETLRSARAEHPRLAYISSEQARLQSVPSHANSAFSANSSAAFHDSFSAGTDSTDPRLTISIATCHEGKADIPQEVKDPCGSPWNPATTSPSRSEQPEPDSWVSWRGHPTPSTWPAPCSWRPGDFGATTSLGLGWPGHEYPRGERGLVRPHHALRPTPRLMSSPSTLGSGSMRWGRGFDSPRRWALDRCVQSRGDFQKRDHSTPVGEPSINPAGWARWF